MGQGFLQLDRFVLTAFSDHPDHGKIALVGAVEIGVFDAQEDLFSDMNKRGWFEVFLVSNGKSGG